MLSSKLKLFYWVEVLFLGESETRKLEASNRSRKFVFNHNYSANISKHSDKSIMYITIFIFNLFTTHRLFKFVW